MDEIRAVFLEHGVDMDAVDDLPECSEGEMEEALRELEQASGEETRKDGEVANVEDEKDMAEGDVGKKHRTRKSLFKPTISTAVSTKMRIAKALVSPRKRAAGKTGTRHGETVCGSQKNEGLQYDVTRIDLCLEHHIDAMVRSYGEILLVQESWAAENTFIFAQYLDAFTLSGLIKPITEGTCHAGNGLKPRESIVVYSNTFTGEFAASYAMGLLIKENKSGQLQPTGESAEGIERTGDHPMLIHKWPHAAWTSASLYWAQRSLKIITTNPPALALRTMHLSDKTLKYDPSDCH
ncbi:hypothetical protein Bca52824_052069 [Brassica carinata]|uniref:Uncharacterized protein n=1 Tax=Brassica carinata TaxID=52824 RepID=A0A8X7R1P1_BRACI|nr:hypothetical protein Bca52824_052069 [Brassica carinata]